MRDPEVEPRYAAPKFLIHVWGCFFFFLIAKFWSYTAIGNKNRFKKGTPLPQLGFPVSLVIFPFLDYSQPLPQTRFEANVVNN